MIDEVTLFLAGISLVVYLYYQWNVFQPDIHLSFLNTQANTSPTRLAGETPVYRHRSVPFSSELSYRLHREVFLVQHILNKVLERETNVLGYLTDENSKTAAWLTGLDLKNQVLKFGNGLTSCFKKDTESSSFGEKFRIIVVSERSHVELVIAMIAGILFSFALDLISPSMMESVSSLERTFKNIFKTEEKPVVICSLNQLSTVIESLKNTEFASKVLVIVMDANSTDLKLIDTKEIRVDILKELGTGKGGQLTPSSNPASSEEVLYRIWSLTESETFQAATFCDKHVMASVASISSTFPVQLRLGKEDIYASPRSILATSEWATVLFMFFNEIPVGLGSSIKSFKPTVAFLPSKDLIELSYRFGLLPNSMKKLSSIPQWLLQAELKVLKRHRCLQNGKLVSSCFNQERSEFGSQLRLVYTSNSFIPLEVCNSLRVVLGIQLVAATPLSPYQNHAKSACFGWAFVKPFFDYASDHKLPLAGGPAPAVESKLVGIPENSLTSSTQTDPIGDVLIRGSNVVKVLGKEVNENSNSEAWLESGLFGRVNPTCSLAVLARKNTDLNALRWIETHISVNCAFIHKLQLQASSNNDVSGVLYLRSDPVLKFGKDQGLGQDIDQIISSIQLKDHVFSQVRSELASVLEHMSKARHLSESHDSKLELTQDQVSFHLAPGMFKLDQKLVRDPEFWE